MTQKEGIAKKCKDCIYDKQVEGTWRQQVERCELTDCGLWNFRPKSRSKIAHIAHSVAVEGHYEPNTAGLGV